MAAFVSAAGMALLDRAIMRYHGDFDWPCIAIARRIFDHGDRPWRFGQDDGDGVQVLDAGLLLRIARVLGGLPDLYPLKDIPGA
jgi:hypothetical protein